MDQARELLRQGLKLTKRTDVLRLAQELPSSKERNYVIAALKDPKTRPEDEHSILLGEHYAKWMKDDVKILAEFDSSKGFNEAVQTSTSDGEASEKESVEVCGQSFDVSVDEVVDLLRRGERLNTAEYAQSDNSKVFDALKIFDEYLSDVERDRFRHEYMDLLRAQKDGKKRISVKKFADVVNKKLSDSERTRLFAMLQKKFQDVYSRP